MHFNKFNSVDELVELSKIEFTKRASGNFKTWIPSRQAIYSSLSNTFSERLINTCDRLDGKRWLDVVDMNPSQFIKAAQDFQLSARMAGIEKNIVLKYFIKLPNLGIELRNHRIQNLKSDYLAKKIKLNEVDDQCKISLLNAALRGLSETLYFDDHTVGGDLYGPIEIEGRYLIYRRYNRLCPSDLHPDFKKFVISRIDTICSYDNGGLEIDDLGNLSYMNNQFVRPNEYYLEVHYQNGGCISIDNNKEIENLSNYLLELINIFISEYESKSKMERKLKMLESTLYAFKPIFDYTNIDWRPTENETVAYMNNANKANLYNTVEEKEHFTEDDVIKVIDPRANIY